VLFSAVVSRGTHMTQFSLLGAVFMSGGRYLGAKWATLIYGHKRTLRPLPVKDLDTGYRMSEKPPPPYTTRTFICPPLPNPLHADGG
jgi:hypothetical protein